MKKYKFLFLSLVIASLSACTQAFVPMATRNVVGTKVGKATSKTIFGFGNINGGIETAAKNGGITKIATVDQTITGGLFTTTYETIVTGE
jgi:TRL-like protein family